MANANSFPVIPGTLAAASLKDDPDLLRRERERRRLSAALLAAASLKRLQRWCGGLAEQGYPRQSRRGLIKALEYRQRSKRWAAPGEGTPKRSRALNVPTLPAPRAGSLPPRRCGRGVFSARALSISRSHDSQMWPLAWEGRCRHVASRLAIMDFTPQSLCVADQKRSRRCLFPELPRPRPVTAGSSRRRSARSIRGQFGESSR
jgi:hypothetical protein